MKSRITRIGIPSLWGLIFFTFQLFGQAENSYQFLTYSNREGFNQNTVKAIEEDKTGTLWLGASNGLIRYDGYSFENISWEANHIQDVYHGPISSIRSDNNGLLWIVSSSGLNLYCPDMERFFKVTSDSLDMLYRTIESKDGSRWVAGNSYLSKVNAALVEDRIVSDWTPNLLRGIHEDLDILDLLELEKNHFLLATSTGLYHLSLTNNPNKVTLELDDLIP